MARTKASIDLQIEELKSKIEMYENRKVKTQEKLNKLLEIKEQQKVSDLNKLLKEKGLSPEDLIKQVTSNSFNQSKLSSFK